MAKRNKKGQRGPFAGPHDTFPVGDKIHDREAISGATRSYNVGNISKSEENHIKAVARKKLTAGKGAKARTGKSKSWIGG